MEKEMDTILLLILVAFGAIIYLLRVFSKGKLEFAKFAVGAILVFFTLFFAFEDIMTPILARTVTGFSGVFGDLFGTFSAYPEYSLLFISHKGETISLYVDYECAGFIEITIYIALLSFFPLYKWYEKVWYGIGGVSLLFLINILRIVLICTCVYIFGNSAFYLSHAILGRFLFYTLSMCVYFYVFTRPQIMRQKIGRFSYDTDIK
jgi:exosortase family protein XrtG